MDCLYNYQLFRRIKCLINRFFWIITTNCTWIRVSSILVRDFRVPLQRPAVHPYLGHAQREAWWSLVRSVIWFSFLPDPLPHKRHLLTGLEPVHSGFEFPACNTSGLLAADHQDSGRWCHVRDCDLFWILRQALQQRYLRYLDCKITIMDSDQRITKEPTLVKEMLTILSYLVGKQVTISVSDWVLF